MLNEKDGLFKKFDYSKFYSSKHKDDVLNILCDSFNKNEEVAGLLKHVGGDSNEGIDYSTTFIFGVLCLTKLLLNNLCGCVDLQFKKEGMIRKSILNGIPFGGEVKKRIEKLPLDTTAADIFNCFRAMDNSVRGIRFHSNSKSKYDPYGGIYINYRKISSILYILEKVGSDDCSLKIIQNAIKEINEVLDTMKNNQRVGIVYLRPEAKEEVKKADAITDNTQTLNLNRHKQQENKIITVGNKTAYQVGPGDWKHRNGRIIEGEKKEMADNVYLIEDESILGDLEDLLNNIIDNPDTVDNLVNYLEKNAPAAHFISEMIGCGEIYDEASLLKYLENAYTLSIGGDSTVPRYYKDRIIKYLRVACQKPVFGKEYGLKQFEHSFCAALYNIKAILSKAKEEEQEEKEEVINVQEHAEEDAAACEEYPTDLAELEKLLEERRKEVADLTVEVKQAEEDKRRRELINELIALDKQKAELNARKAELNKK